MGILKKGLLTCFSLLCLTMLALFVGPKTKVQAAFEAKHYDLYSGGVQQGTWDGTYYHDIYGQLVTDSFFCDGTYTYFLQTDGTPMKDRLTYHPDGVHIIYFDSNGHEVFSNFTNVKHSIANDPVDDLCFFNVYGYMYVDTLTYDQAGVNLYYVNPYGVIERNGWFRFSDTYNGAEGFGNADGTLAVNFNATDPNGKVVYLQGNGQARGTNTPFTNINLLSTSDPMYKYAYAIKTGDTSAITSAEDWTVYNSLYSCLKDALNQATPFLQEVAVHYWLVVNNTYDYNYKNYHSKDVFLYGTTVCQGYAEAFEDVMTMLGIPCIKVRGTANNGYSTGSHAWDAVCLDGDWYMVDVTWDDPGTGTGDSNLSYDYFNVTDAQLSQDHFYTCEVAANGTKYSYDYYYQNYIRPSLLQREDYFDTASSAITDYVTAQLEAGNETFEFLVNKDLSLSEVMEYIPYISGGCSISSSGAKNGVKTVKVQYHVYD